MVQAKVFILEEENAMEAMNTFLAHDVQKIAFVTQSTGVYPSTETKGGMASILTMVTIFYDPRCPS